MATARQREAVSHGMASTERPPRSHLDHIVLSAECHIEPAGELGPGVSLVTAGGSYKVLDDIGQGTFGTVFSGVSVEGEGEASHEYVAIKLCEGGPDAEPKYEKREKDALEILTQYPHPNILKFYGSYTLASTKELVIIMELCNMDLFNYVNGMMLKRRDPASEDNLERMQDMFVQMISGIEHLHSLPTGALVHRDIKLDNFLLAGDENEQVKICDLGLSRTHQMPHTSVLPKEKGEPDAMVGLHLLKRFEDMGIEPLSNVGTLAYLPPEALKGDKVLMTRYSFMMDLWALGVSLFILCTHTYPYGTTGPQILERIRRGRYKSAAQPKFDKLPDCVKRTIKGLMSPDPQERKRFCKAKSASGDGKYDGFLYSGVRASMEGGAVAEKEVAAAAPPAAAAVAAVVAVVVAGAAAAPEPEAIEWNGVRMKIAQKIQVEVPEGDRDWYPGKHIKRLKHKSGIAVDAMFVERWAVITEGGQKKKGSASSKSELRVYKSEEDAFNTQVFAVSIEDCTCCNPKTPRVNAAHALRIDIKLGAEKAKYIFNALTDEQKMRWREAISVKTF